MPSNDTENIYSTPFNEGEAQPIPATRISYDNTDSGLTADDVQGAIDEVASIAASKMQYIAVSTATNIFDLIQDAEVVESTRHMQQISQTVQIIYQHFWVLVSMLE